MPPPSSPRSRLDEPSSISAGGEMTELEIKKVRRDQAEKQKDKLEGKLESLQIWRQLRSATGGEDGPAGKVPVSVLLQKSEILPEGLLEDLDKIAKGGEVTLADLRAYLGPKRRGSPATTTGRPTPPQTTLSEAELRTLFDTLDADRTGGISASELIKHKKLVCAKIPWLVDSFEAIDRDHNNSITWEELWQYVKGNESQEAWLDLRLSSIVGLDELKDQMRRFSRAVLLDQTRRKKGMSVDGTVKYHMQFVGNPGTGKTSCARIMAELLNKVGVTKTAKLVEVQRPDLVAEYVGQTGPKTQKKIDEAKDGVLFIDEAYRLLPPGKSNDFGVEAVETVMACMNDPPGKAPVIILAGYKDDMAAFLQANDGLYRRIGYTFDFSDYTPANLAEILDVYTKRKGFRLDDALLKDNRQRLTEIIETRTNPVSRKMTNGGLCEMIFAGAKQALDSRDDPDNPTIVISEADILQACAALPPPPRKDAASPILPTLLTPPSPIHHPAEDVAALKARITELTRELEKARRKVVTTAPQAAGKVEETRAGQTKLEPPAAYEVYPCLVYSGGCVWFFTRVAATALWTGTCAGVRWASGKARAGAAAYQARKGQATPGQVDTKATTVVNPAAPPAAGSK